MKHVRVAVRILQIFAVLRWLPYLTAYHIPPPTKPGIQTLSSLMSATKHQPLNLLHPPQQNLFPAVSNSSSEEDYDGPSEDSIDRSFKARKIVYKYPVRYAKKKVRPIIKHPILHPKFYTPYSHWSKCDVFCRQRRERFCTVRSKCGYHIHVEERRCHRKLCSPLTIPSDFDSYDSIPLHKYSTDVGVDPWKPKKKKRIIVEEEDDDYYDEEDDTEYVIVKKRPKPKRGKWKRPHIVYRQRKHGHLNHRPAPADFDDEEYVTEQRIQNQRKPLKIILDDFDDQKIFSPSPHYQQQFSTAQKFQRRPHTAVIKRKPQRITDYFEDYYDHLFRDGTGFASRKDDLVDIDGLPAVSEALIGTTDDDLDNANSTSSSTEFHKLMESFPTTEASSGQSHHTKREISNFLDDSGEELGGSEEDTIDGAEEGSPDGKKYPDKSMLKLGTAVTQKKAREKAVFEMPRKVDNPYSKWSRWSKCTAKCTTRRFKRCKIPSICGNDIIREVAYCYTEGSFCEEWIGNQLYQNNKPPQVPMTTIATTPKPTKPPRVQALAPYQPTGRVRSDFQDNSIAQQSFTSRRGFLQPEYMPQELTCGIPTVRGKTKKYMYNMLRIIGGKTSRRGQWPWQVAILNRFKEAFCGGTLVAPRWILTAAHCVRKRLFVRLGEHNLQQSDGTEIEFRIEYSIKHPRYDKKTVDNDVALLRLPRDVERSTYVGYACLPERFQALPTGHTCTIIGWGKKRHSDDSGTDILHEAEVPIITNDRCRAVYHDYTITKNMFCAGHKRGRVDTCAGDSGGPLLCRDTTKENSPWTIFGITSFGDGCGKKNKFGIYTKLPNYVDWIWSVINCNGNCRT